MDREPIIAFDNQVPSKPDYQPDLLTSGLTRPSGRILPGVFFLLTCLTTLMAGYILQLHFSGAGTWQGLRTLWVHPELLFTGAPFAIAILVILLAHEMGHYLTCRYYGIRATLPYVIPAPPFIVPFGTFGAVIRIKSLFRDRKQLFDVGIAGPLAGFVFIVPAMIIGLQLSSKLDPIQSLQPTLAFGEPLLFQLGVRFFFDGSSLDLNLHPVGWAAWFGMLATSLNLLPVGQLDGGHIVYSIFGAAGHRTISYLTFFSLILLGVLSFPMLTYPVFAAILLLLRFRHPRPYFDVASLGNGRLVLTLIAVVVFLLTFIPIPVQLVEHVGRL